MILGFSNMQIKNLWSKICCREKRLDPPVLSGEPIYVGAFVADLNPRYALVLNTCTLSIPGEDDMTHDVVTDSCVNPDVSIPLIFRILSSSRKPGLWIFTTMAILTSRDSPSILSCSSALKSTSRRSLAVWKYAILKVKLAHLPAALEDGMNSLA